MPMTRKQMETVIAEGGSVLHQGRILSAIAHLPTEAELASTDTEKANAASTLQAQIATLQAQVDALAATQPGAAAPPAAPKGGKAA